MDNVKARVNLANRQWQAWNDLGAQARGELLVHWSEEVAQHATFAMMPAKMIRYQVNQGLALISEPVILPGPTGESNQLTTSGRGLFVLCCSPDVPYTALVGMLTTALLAGNCVILSFPQSLQAIAEKLHATLILAGIPESVVQLAAVGCSEQLINEEDIAGVIYAGDNSQSMQLNKQLASREGLLAQLITETDLTHLSTITDSYYILRFITEKTLSINVTAIGGNAALLELGMGDH